MRLLTLAAALAASPAVLPAQAGQRPLVAALSTCSELTPNTYPSDSTSWFEASRHSQVVFYAHLLFPLEASGEDKRRPGPGPDWHPPQRWWEALGPGTDGEGAMAGDSFYAEADWFDPEGEKIAGFGLTMAARVSSDYVRVKGRSYIPHTFAMAVGIKDLRAEAGQKRLPEKAGQYHIRFYVDGAAVGLAFFRILAPGGAATPVPRATATATPQPAAP